jgi:hypothetical protein
MARSTLLQSVVLGVALVFTVAQGCAKQGEGERCEPHAALNSDCDDGLQCVDGKLLLDTVKTANDFGRCCPPEGEAISDSRCARSGTGTGSGGTSAQGGTGGTPVDAGAGGEPLTSAGTGGDTTGAGGGGAAGDGGQSGGGAAGAEMGGAGGVPASTGGQSGAAGNGGGGGI